MVTLAFIIALNNEDLYLEKVGGVPIIIRACQKLCNLLSKEQVVVLLKDDTLLDIISSYGFNYYTVRDSNDYNILIQQYIMQKFNSKKIDSYFVYRPEMVFISLNTLNRVLEISKKDNRRAAFIFANMHCYEKLIAAFGEYVDEKKNHQLAMSVFNAITSDSAYFVRDLKFLQGEDFYLNEIEIVDLSTIESHYIKNKNDLIFIEKLENYLNNNVENSVFIEQDLICRVLSCKLIICDVDGVLTDGKMIYTENGDELRNFNVKDGIAANLLKEKGFKLAILSSGTNREIVAKRGKKLNFDVISIGEEDKLSRFYQILEELNVACDEVLYIGDDINDLQVLKKVGVSVCPRDANKTLLKEVDWILESKGGDGCLREVTDYILKWSSID